MTIEKSDVIDILFKLAEQEQQNCYEFCNLNRHSDRIQKERKHDSRLIQAVLTQAISEVCKL